MGRGGLQHAVSYILSGHLETGSRKLFPGVRHLQGFFVKLGVTLAARQHGKYSLRVEEFMPDPRQRTPVGVTGPLLTRLSFGSATQGGLFQPVSEDEAEAVFNRVWDASICYFDTAPWYGYGQSETRLGAFLGQIEGFMLSSKVGRLLRDVPPHPSQLEPGGVTRSFASDLPLNVVYNFSYDGVMRSVEESLRRMGLNRIDILSLPSRSRRTGLERRRSYGGRGPGAC